MGHAVLPFEWSGGDVRRVLRSVLMVVDDGMLYRRDMLDAFMW